MGAVWSVSVMAVLAAGQPGAGAGGGDGPAPARRLTSFVNAYPAYSPDGRSIVYQSNAAGSWDLYVMGADGSRVRRIVGDDAADITPVWSPDGERVAFVSERDGHREVYVCNPDGSGQRNLTNSPGNDIHPFYSPDGSRIMFSSNRGNADPDDFDVYVMDADGSNVRRITSGPDVDTYASWSPDGTKIVLRRVVGGINGNNEVFLMDADGSNAVNLTNSPLYDGWPVWSPDGTRIAYASGTGSGHPHRIVVMNPDGSGKTFVTDAPEGGFVHDRHPWFHPDGERIVFTRYGPGMRENSELCVVRVPRTG